jgi:cytochrome c-type biogenesis protein CcmH/NrfF
MGERLTRREVLGGLPFLSVAALLRPPESLPPSPRGAAAAQQDSTVGRLPEPWSAGKFRERVTSHENDPFVVGVEEQLRCTCGCNLSVYTCRTTDFTCETSPAMHREVVALVEQGNTAEEILRAFVAQYGETVLMAPPRRGFNLAGYFVPGILILAVGALLVRMLLRHPRPHPAPAAATTPQSAESTDVSPDEAARLRAELERLEL